MRTTIQRNAYRILTLVAAVSVMVSVLAVPAMAGPEGTFFSRINNSRANAGLPPVERYWDLTDDARAHTDRMIENGGIYHNPSLSSVTGVWEALGENVGVGADANTLHNAFMSSSGHRANILGNYNYVGIGAKVDEDGLLWVTVIFMRAQPGLNGDTTTTTAATTTTTSPAPTPAPDPTTTTTTAPPTTTTTAPDRPSAVRASTAQSDPEVTAAIVGRHSSWSVFPD